MENNKKKSIIPTIILTILSLFWIYPIILTARSKYIQD